MSQPLKLVTGVGGQDQSPQGRASAQSLWGSLSLFTREIVGEGSHGPSGSDGLDSSEDYTSDASEGSDDDAPTSDESSPLAPLPTQSPHLTSGSYVPSVIPASPSGPPPALAPNSALPHVASISVLRVPTELTSMEGPVVGASAGGGASQAKASDASARPPKPLPSAPLPALSFHSTQPTEGKRDLPWLPIEQLQPGEAQAVAVAQAELREALAREAQLHDSLQHLQTDFDKQYQTLQRLRAHLIQHQSESDQSLLDLKKSLELHQERAATLDLVAQQNVQLKIALDEQRQNAEASTSQLRTLEQVLHTLQIEKETEIEVRSLALRAQVQDLQATINSLNLKLLATEQLETQLAAAVQASESAQAQVVTLTRTNASLQSEISPLRKALEDATRSLANEAHQKQDVIDKRIVTKLITTYFHKGSNKSEVLELMARILNFGPEERRTVGLYVPSHSAVPSSSTTLTPQRKGWFSSLLGRGSEPPSGNPHSALDPPGDTAHLSLTDLWVKFLLQEAAASPDDQYKVRNAGTELRGTFPLPSFTEAPQSGRSASVASPTALPPVLDDGSTLTSGKGETEHTWTGPPAGAFSVALPAKPPASPPPK